MATVVAQFLHWLNIASFLRPLPVHACLELGADSMASSAKRRAVGLGENPGEKEHSSEEESEEDVDSGEEESEDSEEEINEEVMVDFEAHSITHNDFNGIKKLLQQLFLKSHVNTSEMTDLIIQQSHIGSVVRQAEVPEDSDDDDPDEVFGFISIINLTERKGVQCVEQLKELVLEQAQRSCSEEDFSSCIHGVQCVEQLKELVLEQAQRSCSEEDVQRLEKLLSDSSKCVGLVLSERFINVPPQIALPLHKQLQEEVAEAQRTNKPSGRCHYCLMISKTCQEASKKGPRATPKDQLLFVNAEEEFFYEHAALKFHYSVEEEADSCLSGRWSFHDVPMKPLRTVMLVPWDKIPAVMDKLKEFLTV